MLKRLLFYFLFLFGITLIFVGCEIPSNQKVNQNSETITESEEITESKGIMESPEVTESEVTEPEVTEPEVTEPEVTEPEVTKPEVTEPEVTEPEVTEPEVTEPEVTEPEVTEPEVTEPEMTESEEATESEIESESIYCDINDSYRPLEYLHEMQGMVIRWGKVTERDEDVLYDESFDGLIAVEADVIRVIENSFISSPQFYDDAMALDRIFLYEEALTDVVEGEEVLVIFDSYGYARRKGETSKKWIPIIKGAMSNPRLEPKRYEVFPIFQLDDERIIVDESHMLMDRMYVVPFIEYTYWTNLILQENEATVPYCFRNGMTLDELEMFFYLINHDLTESYESDIPMGDGTSVYHPIFGFQQFIATRVRWGSIAEEKPDLSNETYPNFSEMVMVNVEVLDVVEMNIYRELNFGISDLKAIFLSQEATERVVEGEEAIVFLGTYYVRPTNGNTEGYCVGYVEPPLDAQWPSPIFRLQNGRMIIEEWQTQNINGKYYEMLFLQIAYKTNGYLKKYGVDEKYYFRNGMTMEELNQFYHAVESLPDPTGEVFGIT